MAVVKQFFSRKGTSMKFVWDHLRKAICVLVLGLLAQMASVSGSTAFAQTIFAYAGTGVVGSGGDGGAATSAQLNKPRAMAVDTQGNLYVADEWNHRIRKITPGGVITTVAGTTFGYSGDGGPAISAQLYNPFGVAVDSSGNLYIADTSNHRIRKVSTDGTISTIAGNGFAGYTGDDVSAVSTRLSNPSAVVIDAAGNVLFTDRGNNRIRKVSTAGTISTIAGTGTANFSGDGGAAVNAELNLPFGIALDRAGNLYIADYFNERIRRVNAAGVIETVAGNGSVSVFNDGIPAITARVYFPTGVAVDGAGNIFIAQNSQSSKIRKVSRDGIITTVVGTGAQGSSGNGGAAIIATLNNPFGLATSGTSLFISDFGNERVRKVTDIARTVVPSSLEAIIYFLLP